MKKIDALLSKIPTLLSSKLSIFIYLFLFFYLVCFPIIGTLIPMLKGLIPTDTVQLILGNYTNVLSALGASIAAGAGMVTHQGIKKLHNNHENLRNDLAELHKKLDALEAASKGSDEPADDL